MTAQAPALATPRLTDAEAAELGRLIALVLAGHVRWRRRQTQAEADPPLSAPPPPERPPEPEAA